MCAACSGIASLKITRSGSTATTVPSAVCVNPDGAFIHALAATTDTLPKIPARTIGNTGPEVRPRPQPTPAEDVDRNEDRLGEEEQTLEREGHTEGRAPLAHEPRPQQPELEAQHGAGHRAHRERHGHVLRPALGQHEGVPVVVLDGPVVGDQRHEGPRHAQRHQDDVEHQGERHLRPGPRHRIHRGEHGRLAERRDHLDHSLPVNTLDDTRIADETSVEGRRPARATWIARCEGPADHPVRMMRAEARKSPC